VVGAGEKILEDLEIFALVGQPRWHHGSEESSAESGDEELRLAGSSTSQTLPVTFVLPSILLSHTQFSASTK